MTMLKLKLMIWLAKRLFNYIVVWESAEKRAVLFLGHSERDVNCGTRSYVEALDQYYADKENNKQER